MTSKKPMTQKEFELRRLQTIEMLNPDCIPEMRNCAEALEKTFEEFLEILDRACRDEEYYEHMGDNERYRDHDWEKIWKGYEIVRGRKPPKWKWGGQRIPFSCAC